MIDTDKYEGHTPGPWTVNEEVGVAIKHGEGAHDYVDMENKANAQLMADAPDLLAEIKRLTTMLNIAENNIPRSIHWDCYWEALVEAGLETMEEEE